MTGNWGLSYQDIDEYIQQTEVQPTKSNLFMGADDSQEEEDDYQVPQFGAQK